MGKETGTLSMLAVTREERRESRRSNWINRCINTAVFDGFPDGNHIVEGGLFLRDENDDAAVKAVAVQPTTHPTKPLEIKAPVSRRFPSWLSFFYPHSPPSSSLPKAMVLAVTDSPGSSDVETESIGQRATPPPKEAERPPPKSILKAPKMMEQPSLLDVVEIPAPIKKSTFLIQERERLSELCDDIVESLMIVEKRRKVVFCEECTLTETFGKEEYDRSAIDYIARALTPSIAMVIKRELNEIKAEMEVHEHSRHLTQFYPVR